MLIPQFPHCDQRVLHQPGECQFCDRHPEWQELREKWGIAFTGHAPGHMSALEEGGHAVRRGYVVDVEDHRAVLPCPADFNRPQDMANDHRRWAGNVATSQSPVNESGASRMMYGHEDLTRSITEARLRPGFLERLRANMAKHKDILDRLR